MYISVEDSLNDRHRLEPAEFTLKQRILGCGYRSQ